MEEKVESEILQRLSRVETKLDMMLEDREVAAEALRTALEAIQSAKSAHHRLDEVSDNQKWLWRTTIGGILAGAIALLFKSKGG